MRGWAPSLSLSVGCGSAAKRLDMGWANGIGARPRRPSPPRPPSPDNGRGGRTACGGANLRARVGIRIVPDPIDPLPFSSGADMQHSSSWRLSP